MSYRDNRILAAFKLFWNNQVKKNRTRFVGQDCLGNKYFEEHRPNHHRKYSRFFESPMIGDFSKHVVDVNDIPPAWQAWLRFRRQDPPTEEELKESEEYFNAQQALASQKQQSQESTSQDSKLPKKRVFRKLPFT